MECPRCGFTQPPDRYCAKCGIEMSTFISPEDTGIIRNLVVRNSSFYVFLGTVFLIATSVFIYRQARKVQPNTEPIEVAAPANPQPISPETNVTPEEIVQRPAAPSATSDRRTRVEPSRSRTQESGAAATTLMAAKLGETESGQSNPGTSAGAGDARAPRMEFPLTVIYAEVPNEIVALLGTGQSGATNQWEIIAERLKESPLQRTSPLIYESETVSLREGQALTLEHEIRDKRLESKWGFHLVLKTEASRDNEPAVNARFNSNFSDRNARGGSAQFAQSIRLPNGSVGFIQGLLPHPATLSDIEREVLLTNPVLKVMASPHFQAATPQSEFVIFLEPQTAAP